MDIDILHIANRNATNARKHEDLRKQQENVTISRDIRRRLQEDRRAAQEVEDETVALPTDVAVKMRFYSLRDTPPAHQKEACPKTPQMRYPV